VPLAAVSLAHRTDVTQKTFTAMAWSSLTHANVAFTLPHSSNRRPFKLPLARMQIGWIAYRLGLKALVEAQQVST
jgi:hypothetical protein